MLVFAAGQFSKNTLAQPLITQVLAWKLKPQQIAISRCLRLCPSHHSLSICDLIFFFLLFLYMAFRLLHCNVPMAAVISADRYRHHTTNPLCVCLCVNVITNTDFEHRNYTLLSVLLCSRHKFFHFGWSPRCDGRIYLNGQRTLQASQIIIFFFFKRQPHFFSEIWEINQHRVLTN